MATKIKLQRLGKMREPHYRIVVADARTKRQGRVIETIGQYHPKDEPSTIIVDGDRAKYWLGVGAQPTEAVTAILKVTGDWQSFRGEPAPAPMRVAAPKPDRKAIFDEAARAASGLGDDRPATTPRKKAPAKAAAPSTPVETGTTGSTGTAGTVEPNSEASPATGSAPADAADAPAGS